MWCVVFVGVVFGGVFVNLCVGGDVMVMVMILCVLCVVVMCLMGVCLIDGVCVLIVVSGDGFVVECEDEVSVMVCDVNGFVVEF